MRNSARFRSLVARIKGLEKRLLPKTRPLGDYTARESDHIRAYRILVHAEFESYFEDKAVQIAENALKNYVRKRRTGRVLAALMTFSPLTPQTPPSSLSPKGKFDDPDTRVYRVVAQFTKEVRDLNHGIKEANVISMLYPVGVKKTDLDPTFINTLTSYGHSRGLSAHQSVRAQQPIDPVTELKIVSDLLKEVKSLDLLLQKLIE